MQNSWQGKNTPQSLWISQKQAKKQSWQDLGNLGKLKKEGENINTCRKASAFSQGLLKNWSVMVENWMPIEDFPGYSVSDQGNVRTDKSGRILALSENQFGLLQVGMMRDGEQKHRSVPLLVAKAFLPQPPGPFDTPINLDGDRHNNQVENLAWRPRWFAIKYNQQFRWPYENPIMAPLIELTTREISDNSLECAKRYGLLERDLVFSVLNRTFVWPTYQEFGIWEE